MNLNKATNRIEDALWRAGRSPEALEGGPRWQDEVMGAIHRIGPLDAKSPGRENGVSTVWYWATAAAACLVIGIGWYAFNDLSADAVLAGLVLADPVDFSINTMLEQM
jgi:L-asparaginase II